MAHFVGDSAASSRVQAGIEVSAQYTPDTNVKKVANCSVICRMSASWMSEHAKTKPTAPTAQFRLATTASSAQKRPTSRVPWAQ